MAYSNSEKCPLCGFTLLKEEHDGKKYLVCCNRLGCNYIVEEEPDYDFENDEITKNSPYRAGDSCPHCGSELEYIVIGKKKRYLCCTSYPSCSFMDYQYGPISDLENFDILDEKCPLCGKNIVVRENSYGMRYTTCIDYPHCPHSSDFEDNRPVLCPRCQEAYLVPAYTRSNHLYYHCTSCDYYVDGVPRSINCPSCLYPVMYFKTTRVGRLRWYCGKRRCRSHRKRFDLRATIINIEKLQQGINPKYLC